MSQAACAEYFRRQRSRYWRAKGGEKTDLIDEICTVTGRSRKHVITVMNSKTPPAETRRPGRPRKYSEEADRAVVWFRRESGDLNAKALHVEMPYLIADALAEKLIELDQSVADELIAMSPATVGRRLKEHREKNPHLYPAPLRKRSAPNALRDAIPIRTFADWAGEPPGALQADLVYHSGGSAQGGFLYTLTMIDVCTHWIAMIALPGRDQRSVVSGLDRGRRQFPYPMRSLHSDNGEIITWRTRDWCDSNGIDWTRGRPYQSNDQAVVEQRNSSGVRRVSGRDRYSGPQALKVLDALLTRRALHMNLFQPTERTTARTTIGEAGAETTRQRDEPSTPLRRVLASGVLDEQARQSLEARLRVHSRFRLLADIRELQARLYELRERESGMEL